MNNKLRIGIDGRTFSYGNSISRGIGHYTLNHIGNILRIENNWEFILYVENFVNTKTISPLLEYDNLRIERFVNYKHGDIDLYHIPDPMNTSNDFESPLRIIQLVPTTMLFHDLIPLYFYYTGWPKEIKDRYDLRLEQIEKSNCTILTNSEFTKQDLFRNSNTVESRIHSVWAGLNAADIQENVSVELKEKVIQKFNLNVPFFLHVGALDSHKNFDTVLKSFIYFSKSTEAKLIVVGKKDETTKTLEEVLKKQKINNVLFTGYISREELTVLYQNALSLLFLSRYEGFGFPALEAMANGCPVVTTNSGSLPEVVGEAAILADPDNILAVSEIMKKLYNNDELRSNLSRLGHERAKLFSWKKTALETLSVWKKLTGRESDYEVKKMYDKAKILVSNNNNHVNNLPNKDEINIVWGSPIFDTSGYADEARNLILGLGQFSTNIKVIPRDWSESKSDLTNEDKNRLLKLSSNYFRDLNKKYFNISHNFPDKFEYNNRAFFNIGRTMFETDSLPENWISDCNQMDEIWVPTEFNRETFINAGIDENKLVKIPESIDTNKFKLDVKPLDDLKKIKGFKFLSVFDWSLRKGWDVLLESFLKAFRNQKDVYLIIKTWASNGKSLLEVQAEIQSFLKKKFSLKVIPSNIILYPKHLSDTDLPRLYKSVDAYVSPTRGEGWGRPLMEAMTMQLPTIATRWSGQVEFMNDENSYLIDNKLVEVSEEAYIETKWYKGHKWAEPSVHHLKDLLKEVYMNKDESKKKGKLAGEFIYNNFSREVVAKQVFDHLRSKLENNIDYEIDESTNIDLSNEINSISWEGSFATDSSLGIINSAIVEKLESENIKVIRLNTDETNNNDYSTEINIRHSFPPNLNDPKSGKWITIQPWEFGSIPVKWAEVFKEKTDEIWVPSSYVKRTYIDSGVPEDKIFIIPNGFDPNVFNSNHKSANLKTKKSFKFLFVGGTIYRKGIDILLKAYTELFSSKDDVCLVIKDMGGNSFYNGQNSKETIVNIMNDKDSPEIEYINEFLTPKELAELYSTCDVLVHPYRGEGFGMPILEAMATGLPVMVTNGGACLDFCNHNNSILLNAEKVFYKEKRVGDDATVGHPWMYEVSIEDLKTKMYACFKSSAELISKSNIAYKNVHENYSWEHVATLVKERIFNLKDKVPFRSMNSAEDLNFEELLVEVNVAYENRNFDRTIELIEKIISINGFNSLENSSNIKADLLSISGLSYLNLGLIESAQNCFEEALTINPASSQACFGIGEVFYNAEMLEESKTMFEWAVVNDNQNKNANIRLQQVNSKLNLPENHNTLFLEETVSKEV